MSENDTYIGRKSFVAYISMIIGQVIFIAIVNGMFYGISYAMSKADVPAYVGHYGLMAWKGILIYLVFMVFYHLAYMRSIQWIVTDEGVRIKEGLLPWRKTDYMHPYETIFEAMYHFGFFAKLFRYGACTIRRTEGITTAIEETRMHNAAKIIGIINRHLKQSRQAAKGGPPVHAARTEVEELAALAKLKADGDISTEEYETMKRKIIGR